MKYKYFNEAMSGFIFKELDKSDITNTKELLKNFKLEKESNK